MWNEVLSCVLGQRTRERKSGFRFSSLAVGLPMMGPWEGTAGVGSVAGGVEWDDGALGWYRDLEVYLGWYV